MEKAPDAFRTIGEVSDLLETPSHVLRFWESRFPQIKPVKRTGGRRYYRPGDVALLAGLRFLLHGQGMTIKGVQKVLREQGVRHVSGLGESALGLALDDTGSATFSDVQDTLSQISALQPPPPPEAEVIDLKSAAARVQADLFAEPGPEATPEPGATKDNTAPVEPTLQGAANRGIVGDEGVHDTPSSLPPAEAPLAQKLRGVTPQALDLDRLMALRARLVALRDRMIDAAGHIS